MANDATAHCGNCRWMSDDGGAIVGMCRNSKPTAGVDADEGFHTRRVYRHEVCGEHAPAKEASDGEA